MTKQEILELIKRHTYDVIPELVNHSFKPTDRLKDLGANSVDRVEIIMMTMESLLLNIPRIELFGAETIGDLADIFYDKLSKN